MAALAHRDVWHKLAFAHFAQNPVYFFDTRFLLSKLPVITGWTTAKLEAAIAPIAEAALARRDTRYVTKIGFYVVFGSFDPFAAQETANEICSDILRQIFGRGDYPQEALQRLCFRSSVQNLVEDLGVPPPPKRHLRSDAPAIFSELPERRDETPLSLELAKLYRRHFASDDHGGFRFWPCWDSQRQRITSFACDLEQPAYDGSAIATQLSPATTQCRIDVAALAAASKGIRRIVRRCEPAFVSVPLHIETLSWSKTRNAYLKVLSQIEPKFLALMALRIGGFSSASDLALLSDWIARSRPPVRRLFVEYNSELERFYNRIVGVSGFNLTITDQMRSPAPVGEALSEQIARLKRICRNQNAIASVHNVAVLPELFIAKAHDIRILSGPAIDSSSSMPGPLRPLSFDSVSSDARQEERASVVQEFEQGFEPIMLDQSHPAEPQSGYSGRA